MQATMTHTSDDTMRHAANLAGDAYVSALNVVTTGDATGQRLELGGDLFRELLSVLQMQQLAFEPKTRAFRPHSTNAAMVVQRIDRLWSTLCDHADPAIADAAERLRMIAEVSTKISWTLV